MIQISKKILKKLMAIADANDDDDYFYYIKRDVIEQLKNYNGFDDDALYDFLWDVNELKDEILEEEEE